MIQSFFTAIIVLVAFVFVLMPLFSKKNPRAPAIPVPPVVVADVPFRKSVETKK